MSMDTFLTIGIFFLGVGFLGLAWSLLGQSSRKEKALARIDEYTEQRRRVQTSVNVRNQIPTSVLTGRIDRLGQQFSQTKAFSYFVEDEDKKLLGRAGFGREEDLSRFVLIRIALALFGLAIGLFLNFDSGFGAIPMIQVIATTGIGFMAPKWFLKTIGEGREAAFERELVAVVDVMRLLQGVGLSVDQSIEIMATQLRDLVPITGRMLYRSRAQVKSGVPWNVILKKMSTVYSSDEFKSFVQVLGQIEKFGGAVQEPLKQFSDRLVEKERANAKEAMGKLTVKLTGVMVITMLPALLIMTGGPGIISIIRAFERVGG
ncbi:type II secretion system F family protein [Limnobacter parvus]|uniref:Type II secretion system F family protein n=1 Tax=Limnobacter parvus TaxID=2939690 RepID=A0ABT1XEF3_9BURK|nr:type II secretion system F family protein [Limnobacter parvus]MCR2745643.1 type II secretion system F family protein [Limnobacter parvus]